MFSRVTTEAADDAQPLAAGDHRVPLCHLPGVPLQQRAAVQRALLRRFEHGQDPRHLLPLGRSAES